MRAKTGKGRRAPPTAKWWLVFEQFAREVLARYYRDYDIAVVGTPPSKDGARDAEATILLASAKQPADADLSLLLRLWIEVKGRTRNVELDDVGKNFVRAINQEVAKIILVTNSGFTSGVEPELRAFCGRLRLGYALIDGPRLQGLARRLGVRRPSALEDREQPATTRARARSRPCLTVGVAIRSDPQGSLPPSHAVPVRVDLRAPVFLTADLAIDHVAQPIDVALTIEPQPPSAGEVYPYGLARHPSLDPGGHRRDEFVFFADRRAPVTSDSFRVRTRTSVPIRVEVNATGTCEFDSQLLSDWIPPSRQRALDTIGGTIDRWRQDGRTEAQLLIASAGVGKSHAVALLRRRWLSSGTLEIPLDGDACRSDADVLRRVFERVFPLPPRSLAEDQTADVACWLARAGMTPGGADDLARAVCRDGSVDAERQPVALLAEVLAALLRSRSSLAPVVLLYEDLHKAHASALELLDLAYRNLRRTADARVMLVLTTRPHRKVVGEDAGRWSRGVAALAGGSVRSTTLRSFMADEAASLLRRTVPTLAEHYCRRVLRVVGRSAFGLHEAVAYLYTARLIHRDGPDAEWRIPHPERLSRALRSSALVDATERRLGELVERLGPVPATVLDAAACIGSRFPLEACVAAAGARSADVEQALREFAEHDVLRPATDDPDRCTFDHDLIRIGVLRRMGPLRQREIAARLVDQGLVAGDEYQRALLEYQAGRAREAVEHLRSFATAARARTRHVDAVRALSLAFSAADPTGPTVAADAAEPDVLVEDDDAVRVAEPTRLPGVPDAERRQLLLEIATPLVESLFEIGSGGSERIARAITEGAMLARAAGDPLDRARYAFFQGRRAFDLGRFADAIEHHREADRLTRASARSSADLATDNLLRLAVAQRQAGDREASLQTLELAEATCGASDLRSLARIRANEGAVWFYSDLAEVRRFWESALDAAERSGSPERVAHCLIDVATLDIIEDRRAEARDRLRRAQQLAERHYLQNSLLRVLLNGGCLDLVEGDLDSAARRLEHADALGDEYQLTRRLWRVRTNLGTLHEARGALVAARSADEGAVGMVLPLLEPYRTADGGLRLLTREALALANVALRAEGSVHHERLLGTLDRPLQLVARRLAARVRSGRLGQIESLLGKHCKVVASSSRFVVTE